jgi:hypothetical protein
MSEEIHSGLLQDVRDLEPPTWKVAGPDHKDKVDGGDTDGTDGGDTDGTDGGDTDGTYGCDTDGTDGGDTDGTDH